MNREAEAVSPVLSRRQAYGCLGLGAFALAAAVLCLVLGVMCMAKHGTFECIGLWSVFPLAFLAIGLVCAAVGFQRFTTAGRAKTAPAQPLPSMGAWRPWEPLQPRARQPVDDVIYLPATLRPEPATAAELEEGPEEA